MQVMGANASEAEFKLFIRTIFFPEAVGRKIRPNILPPMKVQLSLLFELRCLICCQQERELGDRSAVGGSLGLDLFH